jgi:hypothetical protein
MTTEKVRFGKFVLDLRRYELTCSGQAIHLERIPMDLLILLIRENGRLVGRDEIIGQLWEQAFISIPITALTPLSEKSAKSSVMTPENSNISKQFLERGTASKALLSRPVGRSQNKLGSCSPYCRSKT